MLTQIILSFFLGILSGTLTGLIPGIHINLISTILISIPLFSFISPLASITFITSMAITHTFLDFIPSIFLGSPDPDTALATLPGHQLLQKGLGLHAINLTLIGSALAILIFLIITPIFIWLIPKIENKINLMVPFLLTWVLIFLIYTEKKNKINSMIVLILAGFLGISTINLSINQPLLPLLTGLFGSSLIITSIKNNTKIPEQKLEKISFPKTEIIKPAISTTLISPICSFLPGIGSSQAALISSKIFKRITKEQFLILLGSINTLVMAVSFLTLFLIGKSRTGAASTISTLTKISSKELTLIFTIILFSSIISYFLTKAISKRIAKNIHKINYKKTSYVTLSLISLLVLIISGPLGILIFATSTTLGLLAIELQTSRTLLMASLIIPTIIFYINLI